LRDLRCLGTKRYVENEETGEMEWQYIWKSFGQVYHEIQHLANIIEDKSLYS
jgi:hypothetical protein